MTAQPGAGRSYPTSRRCSGEIASGSLSGASGSPTPATTNSCGQWLVLSPRSAVHCGVNEPWLRPFLSAAALLCLGLRSLGVLHMLEFGGPIRRSKSSNGPNGSLGRDGYN